MNVLVAGAGGFIGGHLVRKLLAEGHKVKAIDIKSPPRWLQYSPHAVNVQSDLTREADCTQAVQGVDVVYQLAAEMGGMGFISSQPLACMLSSLITTRLLMASAFEGVEKFFYSSSVCVYPEKILNQDKAPILSEEAAYPASPAEDYGWEKLFSERMCNAFFEDEGLETRVARFDTIYGPYCTYQGGREKAPAALIRKVIEAKLSGNNKIEIWGDGKQKRTFLYVDDCLSGIDLLMQGNRHEPTNLGADRLISVNDYVSLVEELADVRLHRLYDPDGPIGARTRLVDSYHLSESGWKRTVKLEEGVEKTYAWIYDQMTK